MRTSLTHVRAALHRVRDYDVVLSDGEHVGIPMALALAQLHRDVRHVVIGHHLDTRAKRQLFRTLRPARGSIAFWCIRGTSCRCCITRSTCPPRAWGSSLTGSTPSSGHQRAHRKKTISSCPSGESTATTRRCSARYQQRRAWSSLTAVLTRRTRAAANPDEWPAHVVRRTFEPLALPRSLRRAAVVVVPVLETSFPAGITTLVEAMSMGKAVIFTATSGLASAVPDDVAITVPPGDREALARALHDLLASSEQRQMLGERRKTFAHRVHNLDVYGNELVGHLANPHRRSATAIP